MFKITSSRSRISIYLTSLVIGSTSNFLNAHNIINYLPLTQCDRFITIMLIGIENIKFKDNNYFYYIKSL